MPSKKKKYNARFPAGRIKKIMQSDEEVGKVAQAVPVIISRTLELFVESLLTKTLRITNSRNAKTLSPSHMKQCIMSENQFDFLRELVKNVPDISINEEYGNYNDGGSMPVSPCLESPSTPSIPATTSIQQLHQQPITPMQQEPYDLSKPSTSCEYNLTKKFSVSSSQQQIIGIKISNGQSVPLIRNGNNIINRQQQGIIGSSATTTLSSPSSSSSSSSPLSSQGIEITCKNSVIAKISIPTLPATTSITNTDNLGEIQTTDTMRNDLKRSWDSISRLRHQNQSPSKILKTTTATISSPSSNTFVTSLSDNTQYSSDDFKTNSEILQLSIPNKFDSLIDSTTKTANQYLQHEQQQNITISPIKLPKSITAMNIKNNSLSITKTTREIISKEIEKSYKPNIDINNKQQQKLPSSPLSSSSIIPAPIVTINKNPCNKPIVNLDYSNLKLLQYHDNNNSNNNNNNNSYSNNSSPSSSSSSSASLLRIETSNDDDNNDNINKFKKTKTSSIKTITTPELSYNSPVINIDLTKIAIQSPTINFNFNNLITPKNDKTSTTTMAAAAGPSASTVTTTTLELDEDYDNI